MSGRRWNRGKYAFLVLITVSAIGGLGTWRWFTVKAEKPGYLLGSVDRGNIVIQVSMTGTLAAVKTVAVGTQVSGAVSDLYADFNSEVKVGQLLAKLDPALFQTQVDQAQAAIRTDEAILNNDLASIAATKANIEKTKVDVLNTDVKYKRIKQLFDEGLETQDDLDTAKAARDAAVAVQTATEAQLESNQAALKADQARLAQAQANLKNTQVNLDHCTITSPISGTVISRNVDKGQTVAASFSTPTMFTIGEDLTKMQVSTNTDEADVGKLKPGMEATFTVDAYPGEAFKGTIGQVRLAATTIQNVVTYNAIISVSNQDLRLKPGMTANVKVVIEKAENVARVPNAALRFRPSMSDAEMTDAFKRASEERFGSIYMAAAAGGRATVAGTGGPSGRGMSMDLASGNRGGQGTQQRDQGAAAANRANRGRRVAVWVLGDDKILRPAVVRLGLTDGVQTQVLEGNLKEGNRVVVGVELDTNRGAATASSTRPPGFGGGPEMGGRGMR
jgi:HlyD family secretion protein